MSATETFEFQTEARQLLDLMIHSVYSHREIFLRELISNSSDALDKLRFEAVENDSLTEFAQDLHIRLEADKEKRLLHVSDNGVGMSRDEIQEYIGTIARSGTQEFLKAVQDAKGKDMPPEMIGQFGVGFYSSFMVADKVELVSRRAGEEQAWRWMSDGDGTYTLEEAQRETPGTTITLHLKDADPEDELEDFTAEWTLRNVVRKYSDFVEYPIKMEIERKETERGEDGQPKEGAEEKTIIEDETLNSMKAIWTRPDKDVTDEEFNEFYKHISHDWTPPFERISYKAEGTSEFRALLFLPSKAPFDMFMREGNQGIHLYIRRVFIMNDCKELIPEYLRFVRGVVDSEDLDLNISREILQKNRQIQIIHNGLVKKILSTLKQTLKKDRSRYLEFWKEFGRVMKEGLFQDAKNKEAILDLCLFQTTKSGDDWVSLAEYVDNMREGQDAIYFLSGESREAIENSPHLEAFRDKDIEVLYMIDPVDEVWVQQVFDYKETKLQSAGKGTVELGSEEERKAAEKELEKQSDDYKSLLEYFQKKLDKHIKEVRLSTRLTSSAVCLVGDAGDMTPQLEQLMKASGQEIPVQKRILEINPKHEILGKMQQIFEKDKEDASLEDYAQILYGQAVLAEGGQLPDPASFSNRVASLMLKSLN